MEEMKEKNRNHEIPCENKYLQAECNVTKHGFDGRFYRQQRLIGIPYSLLPAIAHYCYQE